MRIDYSSYGKALDQLEKSYSYLNSDLAKKDQDLREQFRAATVQAYEYTYELACKMVLRQLEQIVPVPAELREMAFMDLMRSAHEAGLLREAPPFKIYREMRNITSHTYDAEVAEEILSVLDNFIRDARFLLQQLAERNHIDD